MWLLLGLSVMKSFLPLLPERQEAALAPVAASSQESEEYLVLPNR